MPWYGAVVWSGHGERRRYCCQWDHDRGGLELPKGGMENWRRTSHAPDISPWTTARWETWQETGIWLGWREDEDFQWVSYPRGIVLPMGPGQRQSAFVVTELHRGVDGDEVVECRRREWLTLEECERKGLRDDHLQLLLWLDCQLPSERASRRG